MGNEEEKRNKAKPERTTGMSFNSGKDIHIREKKFEKMKESFSGTLKKRG